MNKLLFVGLEYHGYTKEIINSLEKMGYNVTFHSIKPRKTYHKVIQTLNSKVFQRYLNGYHRQIIEKEKNNNYSVVLFLQVHFFSIRNLEALKKTHSNSRFILYNWDSIKTHDYRPFIKFFDKVFTFDPLDAVNNKINYLPLFGIQKFIDMAACQVNANQIYFIGNIVSIKRYEAIQKFKIYCRQNNLVFKYYLKCSPVVYVRLLLKNILPLDVKFKNISSANFLNLMNSSSAVFDFANHSQTGYTMRFIENLCAGKKIISNNNRILIDFKGDEDRILHFKDLNFSGVTEFLEKDVKKNRQRFEEYHIDSFTAKLIS